MALLKGDGSLDVERINKLPLEEYMDVMGDLTQEQVKEYLSKTPIDESKEPVCPIKVNYTINDLLKCGCVNAKEFLNNL